MRITRNLAQRLHSMLPIACVTALCAACDTDEAFSSITVENIAAPDDADNCIFAPELDGLFRSSTFLNTFIPSTGADPSPPAHRNLRLWARLTNGMTDLATEIEDGKEYAPGTQVRAVRFNFDWQCDAGNLAFGVGPIFVPGVALNTPFCDDPRVDNDTFAGRYSVTTSGDTIGPKQTGLISFEPVPTSLGSAFDSTMALAEAANLCCLAEGGCENVSSAEIASGSGRCRELQVLFNEIDSEGSLVANNPEDVTRWQPLSIYTFPTDAATPEIATHNLVKTSAGYPLQMRGRFELLTQDGDMTTSDEFSHEIRICRNCSRATSACTF